MSDKSEIAQFLRTKRVAAGLTQVEVAKRLGYSSSQFVSNWERGIASPPPFMLKPLAKLYKFDANEILEMLLTQAKQEICREFNNARNIAGLTRASSSRR